MGVQLNTACKVPAVAVSVLDVWMSVSDRPGGVQHAGSVGYSRCGDNSSVTRGYCEGDVSSWNGGTIDVGDLYLDRYARGDSWSADVLYLGLC